MPDNYRQQQGPSQFRLLARLRDALHMDLQRGSERGRLVRSAGLTAAMKLGATAIAFLASLIYARALGAHGYGLYAYVTAWAALLTVPVTLGMPGYLLRQAARVPDNLRGLRRWADQRLVVSGLLAALLMACAWLLPQLGEAGKLFAVAALLPLLNAAREVRGALLRARNHVVRSEWPDRIAAPLVMMLILALLWWWRGHLQPLEVLVAAVGAALLALGINELQLRRIEPGPSQPPATQPSLVAALPFLWLGGMYLLNTRVDIIMVGSLASAHDAGIYAIASRAAMLVLLVMEAANLVLAPRIARLYHEGNHSLTQRLITGAARRVWMVSLLPGLVLLAIAPWLLGVLYGDDFVAAALPLQILVGAQLIGMGFGSVAVILNMIGREKHTLAGEMLTLVVNVFLNALLIPRFGPVGAAMATGLALLLRRIMLWVVIRHLGFDSSVLGWRPRPTNGARP